MGDVSIFMAFLAGLLSFISPCVLPLIPGYVGFITGTMDVNEKSKKKNKTIVASLSFVLGFSVIFILLGASSTFIGSFLVENMDIVKKVGGVLIIIFGVHTLGIIKIKALYRDTRFSSTGNNVGAFFMGMSFAGGWTPCIGPILSTILIYASTTGSVAQGMVLLLFYSLGLGIPFLAAAIALEEFNIVRVKLLKHMNLITKVSGILMIITGVMMYTNTLQRLISWLSSIFS